MYNNNALEVFVLFYCYTYANNYKCILRELSLWSDISSDHPIFIKTVAKLTNKNLPKNIINGLNEINKEFSALNEKVNLLNNEHNFNIQALHMEIKKLINEFLRNDEKFLKLLPEVKSYGKEDKVWQVLLNHITHEQRFMFELFTNLISQL
jgi:hypothetical protein